MFNSNKKAEEFYSGLRNQITNTGSEVIKLVESGDIVTLEEYQKHLVTRNLLIIGYVFGGECKTEGSGEGATISLKPKFRLPTKGELATLIAALSPIFDAESILMSTFASDDNSLAIPKSDYIGFSTQSKVNNKTVKEYLFKDSETKGAIVHTFLGTSEILELASLAEDLRIHNRNMKLMWFGIGAAVLIAGGVAAAIIINNRDKSEYEEDDEEEYVNEDDLDVCDIPIDEDSLPSIDEGEEDMSNFTDF